jgi:asparagine synthetase B (glutamine-hydrolysing)
MCGISGIAFKNSFVKKEQLELNNKVMQHRGPDSSGYWISKKKNRILSSKVIYS